MERTLTRIKNMKARRKMSLPASPTPSGSGRSSPKMDTLQIPAGRFRSLSPGDAAYLALERANVEWMQRKTGGEVRMGEPPDEDDEDTVFLDTPPDRTSDRTAHRTVSERCATRKVQWSPTVKTRSYHGGADVEIIRQNLRNKLAVSNGVNGIAQATNHVVVTGRRASLTGSRNTISGRYRRCESVSTVEEEGFARVHQRHGSLPHAFRNGKKSCEIAESREKWQQRGQQRCKRGAVGPVAYCTVVVVFIRSF